MKKFFVVMAVMLAASALLFTGCDRNSGGQLEDLTDLTGSIALNKNGSALTQTDGIYRAAVNDVLTVVNNSNAPDNKLNYQWQRRADDQAAVRETVGTSSTYTVAQADDGDFIRVTIGATDFSGGLSSYEVYIGTGTPDTNPSEGGDVTTEFTVRALDPGWVQFEGSETFVEGEYASIEGESFVAIMQAPEGSFIRVYFKELPRITLFDWLPYPVISTEHGFGTINHAEQVNVSTHPEFFYSTDLRPNNTANRLGLNLYSQAEIDFFLNNPDWNAELDEWWKDFDVSLLKTSASFPGLDGNRVKIILWPYIAHNTNTAEGYNGEGALRITKIDLHVKN